MRIVYLPFLLLPAACESATKAPDIVDPPGVCVGGPAVSPANAVLNVGDRVSLTTTLGCGAPAETSHVWTSSSAAVATVDSLRGVVTAVSPGSATITVTMRAEPSIKGAAAILVVDGSPPRIVNTVTISTINQVTCSAQNACTSVPANLSSVTGALDIALSLSSDTPITSADITANDGARDITVGHADAPAGTGASWQPTIRWNTAARDSSGRLVYGNGAYQLRAVGHNATTTTSSTSVQVILTNPLTNP